MLRRVAINYLATQHDALQRCFPVLFCSTRVFVLRCWRGADVLQETTFASGQASISARLLFGCVAHTRPRAHTRTHDGMTCRSNGELAYLRSVLLQHQTGNSRQHCLTVQHNSTRLHVLQHYRLGLSRFSSTGCNTVHPAALQYNMAQRSMVQRPHLGFWIPGKRPKHRGPPRQKLVPLSVRPAGSIFDEPRGLQKVV